MASANFTILPRALAKGDIDFDTLSAKVLLVSSIPSESNLDNWGARADVTNEITGTGYSAGGIAQAYTLAALDTSGNRQVITYTNITNGWTGASFSAVGAIIYKDTGNAATDILMHFIDFGGTVTASSGPFSITYSQGYIINR
ncbi:MAG: hypothetical protein ACXWT4_06015 [Methylobacter sp.]